MTRQNRKAGHLFAMNKITQDMRFKQAVIEYSYKNGVTKAAIRYKTSRQNIYRWRRKYDGTVRSLAEALIAPTAIQTSTQNRKSNWFRICDAETRTPVWWCSGSSCGNEVTPDPYPDFTNSCAGLTGSQSSFRIPNTLQSLTNRWNIRVKEGKLM